MSAITRLLQRNLRKSNNNVVLRYASTQKADTEEIAEIPTFDEEFRVLNLRSVKGDNRQKRRVARKIDVQPPRAASMATDQDWTAVWPGPRSFHPATLPLAIRQGYAQRGAASPSKWANADLMKIPNFLHLTPQAIKQQCEALKRFCTSWPKGLETADQMRQHFPVEVIHTDYVQALPTIRNPEARKVTIRLKLSDLHFDAHARDKFLRLVGERYNKETDMLTIVADRCPLRKQNYDYALYLLTACYHESFVTEPWEASKSEADMEYYHFDRNASKVSAEAILNWGKSAQEPKIAASSAFAQSVEQLINEGENEINLANYKTQVLQMLQINANSN